MLKLGGNQARIRSQIRFRSQFFFTSLISVDYLRDVLYCTSAAMQLKMVSIIQTQWLPFEILLTIICHQLHKRNAA